MRTAPVPPRPCPIAGRSLPPPLFNWHQLPSWRSAATGQQALDVRPANWPIWRIVSAPGRCWTAGPATIERLDTTGQGIPVSAVICWAPLRFAARQAGVQQRVNRRRVFEESFIDRVAVAGFQVAKTLKDFIDAEAMPGTGVDPAAFWAGLRRAWCATSRRATGRCWTAAMRCRQQIDAWHRAHRGQPIDQAAYPAFLRDDRLPAAGAAATSPSTPPMSIRRSPRIAGPQLVVPVTNARYALNAANARWGSLYDALYGTDAIPEDDGADPRRRLQQGRAARVVIARARAILDQAAPLASGSHADAACYARERRGAVGRRCRTATQTGLRDPAQFVGYRGDGAAPDRRCCCAITACTSRS